MRVTTGTLTGIPPMEFSEQFGTGKEMTMEKNIQRGATVLSADEAAQFDEDLKAGRAHFMRPVATDKGIEGLAEMAQMALAADNDAARGAIANAVATFKRVINRAEASEDERWDIVPSKGPRLEFTGKLLICGNYVTKGREPLDLEFSVYQTMGGALIGVSSAVPLDAQGYETVRATVVEPMEDVQAMHFAIMDGFEWGTQARNIAKKLGWSLRREVD